MTDETSYEGAYITISTSRDTLDPRREMSDVEYTSCRSAIRAAVENAFPGAEVDGSHHDSGTLRDGTDISADVSAVSEGAWEDWCARETP